MVRHRRQPEAALRQCQAKAEGRHAITWFECVAAFGAYRRVLFAVRVEWSDTAGNRRQPCGSVRPRRRDDMRSHGLSVLLLLGLIVASCSQYASNGPTPLATGGSLAAVSGQGGG